MSGLLTGIFDGGQGGAGPALAGSGDGDSQAQGDAVTVGGHAGEGVHLDPAVQVEAGGSYATPDGTTHSWEQSDNIGAHLDADAMIGATTSVIETTAHEL